jgi:hypothetical protein
MFGDKFRAYHPAQPPTGGIMGQHENKASLKSLPYSNCRAITTQSYRPGRRSNRAYAHRLWWKQVGLLRLTRMSNSQQKATLTPYCVNSSEALRHGCHYLTYGT